MNLVDGLHVITERRARLDMPLDGLDPISRVG